jgi:hypothetical protein
MDNDKSGEGVRFFGRLRMALRLLFNAQYAQQLAGTATGDRKPAALLPERAHASGLLLLAALQREGRLVDFLQQNVASFSDEEIGAAARVVHGGCRKVLDQYFALEPATRQTEGEGITVPAGFDSQRFRLTGNVTGQPPFKGTLKHHGWVAREIHLPALSDSVDPRVLAPAEVEL